MESARRGHMSLRLIYGKIGSGKTSFCIKEALEAEKHVYFITPEQFTFTAEKRICSLVNVHGLGGVEVLSLKRLAARILATEEGAALPRLDSRTKAILLQKILVDTAPRLTVLRRLASEPGMAGMLGKLFGEMKRYNVSPDDLKRASESLPHIEKKLQDLAILYEEYTKAVQSRFSDRDDDLYRLAALLKKKNVLKGTAIYLDRFDGFDASEFAAIAAMLAADVQLTVTICFHPEDAGLPPFVLHEKMAKRLLSIAREAGTEILPAVILERPRPAADPLLFLENAYFSYPSQTYPEKPHGLQLVAAPNPLAEVHHVARRILQLCREKGYLFREIAIAARNTAGYERYMEAVLPAYGIPFFMDRTINILEHPFTVFILSALELIVKGYTYDSVFRYVKSGFLRVRADAADSLENYVLATGIKGDIWKNGEKWNMRVEAYSERETEEDAELQRISDETRRKIVIPLLRFEENLKAGKSAAEKCEAIYAFLEEMKVPRRVRALCRLFEKKGDFANAAEYRGVYNDFIEALDGVCDAFGDENIGIRRLYDVLRVALGEVETGIIPSSQDGVSVGSIDRIKGYEVKALFVIGVQDGVFPAPPERGGILSDAERAALSDAGLELASAETKTLYEEEHLIYKCLTIPTEFLQLSFPAASMEGATQRPSRIFQRVRELFPKAEERNLLLGLSDADKISVPDSTLQYLLHDLRSGVAGEELLRAWGWLLENAPEKTEAALASLHYKNRTQKLSEETVRAYMGDTLSGSVSRLEKLAACPFSYYATYMLGAKERKIMQPGASDAGRFLHDFMDIFSRRLRENGRSWREVDDEYIGQEFTEIVPMLDRRLSAYMLENSPRYAHLFVRLQNAVKTAIDALVDHMKKCEFEPLGYELSFSDNGDLKPLTFTLPGGGRVKLTGRIDRADALFRPEKGDTLVRIIDYKSGAKSFDLDDVYQGLNLQLAVYISALCAPENRIIIGGEAKPAGMLYFQLSDPVVDASPMEEDEKIRTMHRKEFKLKGLVLGDEEVLRKMDTAMDKNSDILPARIGSTGPMGSVASGAQFEKLEQHVKKTVTKLLTALEAGNVDVSPYKKDDISACTYCKFASFCAHDGSGFRHLEKRNATEIWGELEAET